MARFRAYARLLRADDASLELIHFLARNLRGPRTLLLAACRTDELDPATRHFSTVCIAPSGSPSVAPAGERDGLSGAEAT